jgi:hypothetical protein
VGGAIRATTLVILSSVSTFPRNLVDVWDIHINSNGNELDNSFYPCRHLARAGTLEDK